MIRTAKPAIDTLAEFLADTPIREIPERVFARGADCALDVVGAAAGGRRAMSVRAMESVITAQMAAGNPTIWFSGRRTSPAAAATVNAMAATALDIDDGHRKACGHPGAAVVAAAIAMAEETDATLADTIAAVVFGYEAAVRVARARNPEHHTSTVSGRWSGIGAAAAAARLRRVSPPVMAQAILIAEQHAPRVSSAKHHGFAGSHVKEGIAWSVLTGMMAVDLAISGFLGYPETFDQDILYDPAKLTGNIGAFDAINGLFFKPYACCRWIHAAIDGVLDLMDTEIGDPALIETIVVHTIDRAVGLGNHVNPGSEAEAQFSVPFCIAAVIAEGKSALTPLDTTLLGRRDLISLAEKVRVVPDNEMEAMFPAKAPAIVRIHYNGKIAERRIEMAFGDPGNPMSRADLQQKFRVFSAGAVSAGKADRIIDRFDNLSDASCLPVRAALDLLSGDG